MLCKPCVRSCLTSIIVEYLNTFTASGSTEEDDQEVDKVEQDTVDMVVTVKENNSEKRIHCL